MASYPPYPPPLPPAPYEPSPYLRTPDFPGKVHTLGIIYLVLGILALLITLGGAVAVPFLAPASVTTTNTAMPDADGGSLGTTTTVATTTSGPTPWRTILVFEGLVIAIGLLGAGLPLAAAYGLLKRKPWGRTVALVYAFLVVLSIPIGTAVGGYTMYLLLQSGARESYAAYAQGRI